MKTRELSVLVCACNPRTWESKARGLLLLHSELMTSLDYLRYCLKNNQQNKQAKKNVKLLASCGLCLYYKLEKLRQKSHCKLNAKLGYMTNSEMVWAIELSLISEKCQMIDLESPESAV